MTNKEFFIQCWTKETKITSKAVKALPADFTKLSYKPHEKTRSAQQIIEHILPHSEGLLNSLESGSIIEESKNFKSIDEAASYLEKNSATLLEKLAKVDDKTWETKIISLTIGGNKIYEAPMMNMFWTFLFDVVHHRGQLSTYYRAMGMRNPSIYGPTAEDMEEAMANKN